MNMHSVLTANAFVLLPIRFFVCLDDSIVGQVGNLRPIGNRPARSTYSHERSPSPFAACCYVGQAILPAAAFQAALPRGRAARPQYWLRHGEARRLKAGGSQDWLLHTGAKLL
jgi:hypothetical protein